MESTELAALRSSRPRTSRTERELWAAWRSLNGTVQVIGRPGIKTGVMAIQWDAWSQCPKMDVSQQIMGLKCYNGPIRTWDMAILWGLMGI